MSSRRYLVRAGAALLVPLLLVGCVQGERPELVDDPAAAVVDPVVRSVLDRLTRQPTPAFTAVYSIAPASAAAPTEATVIVSGGRRRITVGDVDYRINGATLNTCSVASGECVVGLDEARISNLQVSSSFWSDAMATRLALDAARANSPAAGRAEQIAGQSATCADLAARSAAGDITIVYCALDAGPLARYAGADVTIELISFSASADESLLDA